MADILKLQVKDDTLNNVISNSPYYIDIKGAVNICLIRCGQEIESCNSVNFSTMTNYGKILVLNTDTSKVSKCNIKLAFDNINDSLNNSGESNYKFEKAFFTVPSLHKLNGQIYDMETFLLFSSLQKNGTILYVCLCTFNTGTNIVQNGDPKLLNFKLLNELFSKNNSVPDMYGTNQINGIPNPVDISNFIPEEGSRNFYDYTHPSNMKVNFRVFQTPMYVSNDILTLLKSKLTPGNIYTNFRDYINKSLNPIEGLFFYFSEDLTNRYKSFQPNNINIDKKQKDSFENISDSIIEEQELHENEENFKKLENKKNNVNEENDDDIDENNEDKIINKEEIKKAELFNSNQKNESNQSITLIIFILSFILIVSFTNIIFMNNFFTPSKNIDESDLYSYLHELNYKNVKSILAIKFKYYSVLFWQTIITFITIVLLVLYMSNNSMEQSIYTSILIFLFLIFINGIILCVLNVRYFIYRLKSIYDPDFSQKENYFFNYISNEMYKSDKLNNIIKIIKGDFSSFIKTKISLTPPQSGGSKENEEQKDNLHHTKLVPAPNDEYSKFEKEKEILDDITFFNFSKLFEPEALAIIYEKFKDNKSWKTNGFILIFIIILFFIIGIIFQLKYISTGNSSLLKIIVSSIVLSFTYFPIALFIISLGYWYAIDNKLQISVIIISCIALIMSFFIPMGIIGDKKYWVSNIPFWLCIGFFIISVLLLIVGKFVRVNVKLPSLDVGGLNPFSYFKYGKKTDQNPSAPPMSEYYEVLKTKLEEEESKRILYQKELERLYSTENNYNKDYIEKLENSYLSLKEKLNEIESKNESKEKVINSDLNNKILSLENEIKNKEEELILLREKIKDLEKKFSSTIPTNEQKKRLNEEIIRNKDELLLKNINKNKLVSEYLKLKEIINEQQEKLVYNNINGNNKLKEIIHGQQEKLVYNNTSSDKLKEKTVIINLNNEILLLKQQIENKEKESNSLIKKINDLEKELSTKIPTVEEKKILEENKNELLSKNIERNKLSSEYLKLTEKLELELENKDLLTKNILTKNKTIEELKFEIEKLKNELNKIKDDSEKENLKSQIKILTDKINNLEKDLSNDNNKNSSILVSKEIIDEEKEKAILFKEFSINDLKKNIEAIIEETRLFKLYSVSSNLLYTLKLIDKLKSIEGKRTEIKYNEEILRILNKLKKINPQQDYIDEINEDLNKLEHIKNNKLYEQFSKNLSSITSKIRNIVSQIETEISK